MPESYSEPIYRSRPGGFEILPASQPTARRVCEDIYVSEGLSNAYLVTTAEGRVVINTGMGFEAPVHKRNFDAVDASPIRYILLTQGHVDHVGGVDLFRERDTEIVAQENNAAQQADDLRIAQFRARRSAFAFADAIASALRHIDASGGPSGPSGIAQSHPEPTRQFADRDHFELGGKRFELISTPGGETLDSMVVWLPQRRICFAGNLFSALFGHFPNLVTIRGDRYRDALRFVESLDCVRALEPEWLLVGHHGPVEGRARIRAELDRLRAAVLYVHDETVRGMNEGRDVYTLMREIALPPELEVGEGYGKVSWGIRAIYEGYAGFFRHRSTTELYEYEPEALDLDLLELAGGAERVLERARAKLAAGELLAAIRLAEIACATEPPPREALETNLEAHARLEAKSENFWLSSWLREQMRRLRVQLAALSEAGC